MGGKSQTVTQKTSPWSVAQPFLKNALGQAEALYKAGDFSATPYSGIGMPGSAMPPQGRSRAFWTWRRVARRGLRRPAIPCLGC